MRVTSLVFEELDERINVTGSLVVLHQLAILEVLDGRVSTDTELAASILVDSAVNLGIVELVAILLQLSSQLRPCRGHALAMTAPWGVELHEPFAFLDSRGKVGVGQSGDALNQLHLSRISGRSCISRLGRSTLSLLFDKVLESILVTRSLVISNLQNDKTVNKDRNRRLNKTTSPPSNILRVGYPRTPCLEHKSP